MATSRLPAAHSASPKSVSASNIFDQLTIGIKHTSRFARRRTMLEALLHSIREQHGHSLRVLIADDGGKADSSRLMGAKLITLPESSGLSYGRNALVRATQTPFVALMDDDVLFHGSTRLDVLLEALRANPNAVLAAGCYVDVRFPDREDCFNLQFDTNEGGSIVHARPLRDLQPLGSCQRVHAAHNFFVGRTNVLRRFGWDPRQKVMEHETFFYQLHLNEMEVLACSGVSVRHNTTRDEQYRERSFRLQEARFMQFLCKNLPEVKRFQTPYLLWRCDTRSYCSPAWHAQFPYDGQACKPMRWGVHDDTSTVRRPVISTAIHAPARFTKVGDSVAHTETRQHVPLLVLIMTEKSNVARREWQRATWLSFPWHRGYLDHRLVPWRHVYIMAKSAEMTVGGDDSLRSEEPTHPDLLVGDVVTLQNVTESYSNLVFKTMEALRWALRAVSFEVVLKVDDDSIVHVGRLWVWIFQEMHLDDPDAPPPTRLYAGRVFRNSQVIRRNFTRKDLWHPGWFPGSFHKWAVDSSVFAEAAYPPYCGGGGYVLGAEAASRIIVEYDAKFAGRQSIIPVEDAFIGVLAHARGIVARDLLTFQEPPRGSLQTRETFIDQILVHRVVEPYKAFRWLMLSTNCHAGRVQCDTMRNRTHGISPQTALTSSPDAPEGTRDEWALPRFDKDWVGGSIPRGSPGAFTGSTVAYDRMSKASMLKSHEKRKRKSERRRVRRKNRVAHKVQD